MHALFALFLKFGVAHLDVFDDRRGRVARAQERLCGPPAIDEHIDLRHAMLAVSESEEAEGTRDYEHVRV
jgi:hypothetical protein